jgi:hypothetical protein
MSRSTPSVFGVNPGQDVHSSHIVFIGVLNVSATLQAFGRHDEVGVRGSAAPHWFEKRNYLTQWERLQRTEGRANLGAECDG